MLTVEQPVLAAVVARSVDPKVQLAAWGLTFSLVLVLAAPSILDAGGFNRPEPGPGFVPQGRRLHALAERRADGRPLPFRIYPSIRLRRSAADRAAAGGG